MTQRKFEDDFGFTKAQGKTFILCAFVLWLGYFCGYKDGQDEYIKINQQTGKVYETANNNTLFN
jgi:hypothetical protein